MRKIELIGKTFGKLTVLSRGDTKNGQIFYNCICECGNQAIVRGDLLRTGKTSSCGCKLKKSCEEFGDRVRKSWIVHGVSYGTYDLCKEFGISVSTFYRRIQKYDSAEAMVDAILTEKEESEQNVSNS